MSEFMSDIVKEAVIESENHMRQFIADLQAENARLRRKVAKLERLVEAQSSRRADIRIMKAAAQQ